MTTESAQAVREKRVRIHKAFPELIAQLRAVRYNDRGHPDKTELSFDLGDCFLMGCNYFKTSRIRIIKIDNPKFAILQEKVCQSCQSGNHSNSNHSMWQEDEDDIRTITCKCEKCLNQ